MKYLDGYPELDLLSKSLSFSSPSLRVTSRIEAYSCKAIARERKLFKTLEQDLISDLSLSTSISPPEHHSSLVSSAFGPLDRRDSRKTLWLLIATLNIAFPDHDFSRVSAEEFVREESARFVLQSLSSALSHLRTSNGLSAADGPQAMAMGMMPGSSTVDHYRFFSTSAPSASSSHNAANKQQRQSAASTSKGNAVGTAKSSKKAAAAETANAVDKQNETAGGEPVQEHQPRSKNGEQKKPRRASKTSQDKPSTSKSPVVHVKKPMSQTMLISRLRNDLDGSYEVPTHPLLRQVLDPLIDLAECEVYSYTPDLDSDPHAYQSDDEDLDGDLDEETDDDFEDLLEEDASHAHHHDREGYDDIDMDLDYDDAGASAGGYLPAGYARQNQWESQLMDGVESTPGPSAPATPTASTSAAVSASGSKRVNPSSQKRRATGGHSAKRQARQRGLNGSIFPSSSKTAENGIRIPPANDVNGGAGDAEDEEEDNGGLLWSTNYFFYNRKMKRILFVSVWGRKIGKQFSPSNAILARGIGGNPLHAYRRESQFYNQHGTGRFGAGSSRPGTVKINLNRLGSPGLNASGVDENHDHSRRGASSSGGPGTDGTAKVTRSSQASAAASIGANEGTESGGSAGPPPSFAAPPPTAHAASIFKPSSPFPKGDNRHYGSISTSRLQQSWTGSQSTGGSEMPPMVRDSSGLALNTGALAAGPSNAGAGTGASLRPRRERSQSSNPNTPSRRSAQGTPRPHKRQASTPSAFGNAASPPASAAGKRRTNSRK